jgi:hypothetical protein
MKLIKYLLWCVLSFYSTHIIAQTDSIRVWNKWCSNADTPVLFNKANNIIIIHVHNIPAGELVIKSLDNALKIAQPEVKGDTISMLAMPYPKSGKRMRLAISRKDNHKLIKTITFTGADIPAPAARLGNITTDKPAKKEILAQNYLRVFFPNSFYNYPYRVKEYTFRTRMGGKDIVIPVKGYTITKEVQNILSLIAEGTFVEFTNITATCPECDTRTLETLRLWVK